MKVFIGQLERFGYTLTVVSATEKEAREALLKKYVKAYKARNGVHPKYESDCYSSYSSYYDCAKEEMYIEEVELNQVLWL